MSETHDGNTGWRQDESGDVIPPHTELGVPPTQPHIDHPEFSTSQLSGPAAAREALTEAQQRARGKQVQAEELRTQEVIEAGKLYAKKLIDPHPYKKDK